MLIARVETGAVSDIILSAYDSKGRLGKPRAALQSFGDRRDGWMTKDAAKGLVELHHEVTRHKGELRIVGGSRDIGAQAAARFKYLNWLKAKGEGLEFDPHTMKRAFVARPGRSFHNAGRAIDVDVKRLNFAAVSPDKQLDLLWELARPIGWRPVIKAPWEEASEAWHFDFMGPWAPVYDRIGYAQAALCACLDIGQWGACTRPRESAVQAHLHRAGYDVGDVDGVIGGKTEAGLKAAGIDTSILRERYAAAVVLESSEHLLFAA